MDFFARQERARAQTRQLILLFVLAVIVVDLAVTAVLVVTFGLGSRSTSLFLHPAAWLIAHAQLVASAAVAVLIVILVGTAVRSLRLSDGAGLARAMGADLVDANTSDPLKQRLRNVVEEMAIASGVPVPAVYVMDRENGLNAFAAGYTPADSVICVTRGALERFDRAELEGVIGHEFSHILNGDIRLNMRLIGYVAGLFGIATVGRMMLGGRRGGGLLALAGVGLIALGFVGLFLGRLIQAAISRQREFLADASAVQFTRDPQGLRDALVKVGASEQGSSLHAGETGEMAHMLFASSVPDLFSTHPPLIDRIRALDPSFQPDEFERVAAQLPPPPPAPPVSVQPPVQVGPPRPSHLRYAEGVLAALPVGLTAEATDPSGARVMLAALLGVTPTQQPQTTESLAAAFGADVAAAAIDRRATLGGLSASQRLALLLQAVPTLGRLPLPERRQLLDAIDRLIRTDGTITLSEYALARLARVHLSEQFAPPKDHAKATLLQLEPELQVVLSTVARFGSNNPAAAREAYEYGLMKALPGRNTPYQPLEDWVPAIDAALDRLDLLRPSDKPRLLEALANIVAHDGAIEVAESELLRAICGSLHCPLPPFVEQAEA